MLLVFMYSEKPSSLTILLMMRSFACTTLSTSVSKMSFEKLTPT